MRSYHLHKASIAGFAKKDRNENTSLVIASLMDGSVVMIHNINHQNLQTSSPQIFTFGWGAQKNNFPKSKWKHEAHCSLAFCILQPPVKGNFRDVTRATHSVHRGDTLFAEAGVILNSAMQLDVSSCTVDHNCVEFT
jgi:hypothetical protein